MRVRVICVSVEKYASACECVRVRARACGVGRLSAPARRTRTSDAKGGAHLPSRSVVPKSTMRPDSTSCSTTSVHSYLMLNGSSPSSRFAPPPPARARLVLAAPLDLHNVAPAIQKGQHQRREHLPARRAVAQRRPRHDELAVGVCEGQLELLARYELGVRHRWRELGHRVLWYGVVAAVVVAVAVALVVVVVVVAVVAVAVVAVVAVGGHGGHGGHGGFDGSAASAHLTEPRHLVAQRLAPRCSPPGVLRPHLGW